MLNKLDMEHDIKVYERSLEFGLNGWNIEREDSDGIINVHAVFGKANVFIGTYHKEVLLKATDNG